MTTAPIMIVQSRYDAAEAEDWLMDSVLISNDVETLPKRGFMNIDGYSGLHRNGHIRNFVFPFYVDKNHQMGTAHDLEYFFPTMARVSASGIPFTFHNGAYDLFWKNRYGLPVANYAYDSMTMFWSLWPELPKDLAFVSSILLDDYVYWKGDAKTEDWFTYCEYNGKDNDRTLRNTLKLIDLLTRDTRAAQNFIHAHMRVLIGLGMSMKGVRSDEQRLAEHGVTLKKSAEEALSRLRYLVADDEFNPNSPKQKTQLLYEMLGARFRNERGRFVKKLEDASSGAVALRAMRSDHPVFRRVANGILEAIEPAKQISNVLGIKRPPWHRFYTAYNGVGTTTTRFSSSETPIGLGTNAQNIRADYRDWLVADSGTDESDPDAVLLDIDLSAGDDVFVSFESADPDKIELFRSGKDTHALNTTLFFPTWTYEEVVRLKKLNDKRVTHPITGIRQITKKLSHGCNYLMAALTLLMTAGREAIVAAAKEVGYDNAGLWTQERLAEFCASREALYRNHYTRFRRTGPDSWYTDLRNEAIETGGFTTPFGYYQRFLGDAWEDGVLRALAATAGQAGTAGRINMAMEELVLGVRTYEFRDAPAPDGLESPLRVDQRNHGVSLRLQTHDSLTFNVSLKHPNWEEGVDNIFRVMKRPVVIRNKLTGGLETFALNIESGVGYRWGKGMEDIKSNSLEGTKLALQKIRERGQVSA